MATDDELQMEMFPSPELTECELITPEIRRRIECEESAGKYTAVRLKQKKPAVYNAALAMLSMNLPISQVAELCSIHFYTVAAIAKREPKILAEAKERFANLALVNSIVAQEKLSEMLSKISTDEPNTAMIYQLATASGIMIDKANLLSGGATARIQVEGAVKYQGDMEEFAKQYLKPRNDDVEAEVIDQ